MIYIFFRAGSFYPICLGSDEEAIANALANPGTTQVTRSDNTLVWQAPKH